MIADPKRSRKPKRSLRTRWLDFCEDTDHYLNKGKRHTTHAQGFALLFSAIFRWLRFKLGLDWIRTWWLKRLSDRALRKAQNVETKGLAKFIEKLEATATTIGYSVKSGSAWLYKLVVPEKLIKSTERTVATASSSVSKTVYELIVRITERLFPKWLRQRFNFVGKAFSTCYFFFTAWTKSRDPMKLAWSLPAALLAVPLMTAIVLSLIYNRADKIQHYQQALADAIDSRDEPTEQLCVSKLTQLGYQNLDRSEYYAAYMLGEEGNWDEAVERMRGIAPNETAGYAPAHIWIARYLMYEDDDAENRWQQIETHAKHAQSSATGRQSDLKNEAKRMLAQCELNKGNTEEAMGELEILSNTRRDLYFELLERYMMLRDREKIRSFAGRVDAFCNQRIREARDDKPASSSDDLDEDPPVLTAMHYATWSKAARVLEKDPQRAIDILSDGLVAHPGAEPIESQLQPLLYSKIASAPLDAPEMLEWLSKIFQIDPNDSIGMEKIGRGVIEQDQLVREILNHLEEKNLLPPKVCMHAGDVAWGVSHDAPKAIEYYEWAAKLSPDLGSAWNNVAWMRGCVDETRDLTIALDAANRAIELDQNAACYETRGQILVQLKRWEDAVRDFQLALNGALPDSRPAHRSLAEALEALGQDAAAEAHRRLAEGT